MLGRLILLIIIGGMAELYILIKIGSHIGGFNTILLVVMTQFWALCWRVGKVCALCSKFN